MTFHAYNRARRLGAALGQVKAGARVSSAAFEVGYESLSGFQEAFRRYFGDAPTQVGEATVVKVSRITTPLGPMLIGATDDSICLLEFVDRRMLPNQVKRIRTRLRAVFVPDTNDVIEAAEREVDAYFCGQGMGFGAPFEMCGTEFQREVWCALLEIPYGEVRSYADVATSIGRPSAVRAVGRANGMNALAIVVPCHRVVGADGALVGYGGGLWRKKRLLELERANAP